MSLFFIPKRVREDQRLSEEARATGRGSRPNQWTLANLAQARAESASNSHARKLAWEHGSCSQRRSGWGRSRQSAASQSSQDRRLGPGPAFPVTRHSKRGWISGADSSGIAFPSLPPVLLNYSKFLSFCPFSSSF